ncbi:hypothetical protein [Dactylosporangium vinaceum]|uniref:Uncharacterized protein n=1 Tax=Dactylosporangium vinaceum TaxID=53362 RepID=A0ABV5MDL8_9ACTN|nr:hypothetical protein [Dactylosporangium vinaceum]
MSRHDDVSDVHDRHRTRYRRDERRFGYFSTVTTLGTAQDITLQELRIECFFPADAETRGNARAL